RRTLAWKAPSRPTPRIAIFTRRDSKLRVSLTPMKLAGAPISWGVCEVPDWGLQLAPDRVLSDMRALGVDATEAGPPGFLPADPAAARALLDSCGLRLVGGFVTAVLHESARRVDELGSVTRQARWLAAGDAEFIVLAPALAQTGYSAGAELSDGDWRVLFDGIDRVVEIADANGLGVAVHPHWGTAIERPHHIERFLEETRHALCLDTGHVALGGADPLQVARDAGPRVRHVHLKDVDGPLGARVREGKLSYNDAIRAGLFRPLGDGVARIEDVLGELRKAQYAGWYVLEHDVMLDREPAPGPPDWTARSIAYARTHG
ncbi:MAG TPA: TIM barrel protein, partial [Candidatus Limnocylindria bacterium]|nr:TIM barrel protein [Candidatus Limnocylindria bacterium]